jgi:hypothetical protein
MRIGVFAAAILLSAASFPVIVHSEPTQSVDPGQTAASDPDKVVCKTTGMSITGTRFGGHRECHTGREWSALENPAPKDSADKQASPPQP